MPVELHAADQDLRIGIARQRNACDMRTMHPLAGETDFLDCSLVLLWLEGRKPLLEGRRLRAVNVRLQVGKTFQLRLELRDAAAKLRRNRRKLAGGRVEIAVEGDDCRRSGVFGD